MILHSVAGGLVLEGHWEGHSIPMELDEARQPMFRGSGQVLSKRTIKYWERAINLLNEIFFPTDPSSNVLSLEV